ncbi:TriB protein [Chromobacterium amazonense]|uniref:TriB protein n=1 Tax=Chromobacterium amazonense TaxID=1382803 RepID=A0A2S9WYG6_9NEIS|nr:TrbC/VirB2 family protein [Chromobacterium amazonense]PRP68508.1 TriB protein [Chromobacterium amazonense]
MKMKFIKSLPYLAVFLIPNLAFAGFDKANTLLQKVSDGLFALALVTVTLAAMWVGYKVLFGGSTIRECGPVIIGAVIIASASQIGSMLTA